MALLGTQAFSEEAGRKKPHTHEVREGQVRDDVGTRVLCVCFCNAGSCVGTGPMSVQLLVHMEGFSLSMLFCISA